MKMKKIAISAMLISLMGLAQAQLTVYGKARVFEESTTVGSAASVMSLTNDGSRIGFKATEKFDSGLSANVVIETGYGADAPAASSLGDRTSLIGLSNKYVSVGFGRDKHAVVRTLDNFDALANSFGSSASVIHTPQGSRLQNAMFLSATPMTGVTVNYQNANSEVPGTPNAQVVSVDYSVGPLAATVGRYDNGTTSASNIVGAKFKYSNTTVFGMYSNDTVSNVGTNGKSVGVNQAMGATTLMASYGEKEGTKAYDLGATYNLSKNTMLHARYVNESSTVDTKKIGVGMEMNF
jgi:predicted porin